MTQDLIVLAIITFTAGYIIFGFVKNLRGRKSGNACGGCTGCEISKNRLSCSSPLKKF